MGEHVFIYVFPRTSTKAIHHRFDLQDKLLSCDMICHAILCYLYTADMCIVYNNTCATSIYCRLIYVANAVFSSVSSRTSLYCVIFSHRTQSIAISQSPHNSESIPSKLLFFSMARVMGMSKKTHLEICAQLRCVRLIFNLSTMFFRSCFANANVKYKM